MVSPEADEALATPGYWDGRYAVSNGEHPTHEWLRTYATLEPFLIRHLFEPLPHTMKPRVLHLGSGDSTIPSDLASRGYGNQICLDFSPVVVELMSKKLRGDKTIEWALADVRNMDNIATGSVDVAFDKSTLDAMIYGSPWSPPKEVKENTSRYLHEVFRVLRDDGVFLFVSFRQPHFLRILLDGADLWDTTVDVLMDPDGTSFDYHGFVLTKRKEHGSIQSDSQRD